MWKSKASCAIASSLPRNPIAVFAWPRSTPAPFWRWTAPTSSRLLKLLTQSQATNPSTDASAGHLIRIRCPAFHSIAPHRTFQKIFSFALRLCHQIRRYRNERGARLVFGPRGEEMTPLRANTNLIALQGGQKGGHLAVSYCSTADNKGLQNFYSAVRSRPAPPNHVAFMNCRRWQQRNKAGHRISDLPREP